MNESNKNEGTRKPFWEGLEEGLLNPKFWLEVFKIALATFVTTMVKTLTDLLILSFSKKGNLARAGV